MLLNSVFGRSPTTQRLALEAGAVRALQRTASAGGPPVAALAYSILGELLEGCDAAVSAFITLAGAVQHVVLCCSATAGSKPCARGSRRAARLVLPGRHRQRLL